MANFYARYNGGIFGGGGGGGGGGTGDVVGPSSATDNAIARFDGTTGRLIQNSNAILDDSGNVGFQGTVVAGQVIDSGLTVNTVPYTDGSKQFISSAVTPTQLGYLSGAGGTTGTGNLVFSSAPTLANPVVGTQTQGDASTKAASTAYVDTAVTNALSGVNPAVAVQAATTAAADTSALTYNNGASGIGATLTGSINTALTIDGFTFTTAGQRLLVKNDTQSPSGAFNGIYFLAQVQTIALPPILTRALDYDTPANMNNTGAIPVVNGTVNGTTSWVLTSQVVTVGTTPLTFVKFSINPSTIVTVVSVASANGLAGSSSGGTTPALTLSTTITGVLKGNGTAISAASSGTDYQAPISSTTPVSHQFLTGFTAPNTFAQAQPAFTDISGSVAASQMPALTGDVTTSAGAVATTLATVNSNVGSFTAANITVNAKGLITAAANGTATIPYSEIYVDTGNGHGTSGNTNIRILSNTRLNTGSDMTLSLSSGTDGTTITVNNTGTYTFTAQDWRTTGTGVVGLVVNYSGSSNMDAQTYATGQRAYIANATNFNMVCTWTGRSTAGDVWRMVDNGSNNGNNSNVVFHATRIG